MAKTMSIGQDDILRGKTVDPGWYPAVFKKCEDTTASTGTDGWICTFVIQKEGSPFNGVPVAARYWESAVGMAIPLIAALKGVKPTEIKPTNLDLEAGVGKVLMVHIVNGTWQNRKTNDIDDFKPMAA